jgi:hypothetical protein
LHPVQQDLLAQALPNVLLPRYRASIDPNRDITLLAYSITDVAFLTPSGKTLYSIPENIKTAKLKEFL